RRAAGRNTRGSPGGRARRAGGRDRLPPRRRRAPHLAVLARSAHRRLSRFDPALPRPLGAPASPFPMFRLAAAVELLQAVLGGTQPADREAQRYFRARPALGARERRAL